MCGFAAVVLFAGLSGAISSCFSQEVSLLQLARSVVLESRRTEALRYRSETLTYSLTIKKAIVAEILAGRLTLHESAPQFEEANELIDTGDSDLLAAYYIPTTNEAVCEQILTWVRSEAERQPGNAAKAIVEGLESEFQKMFGRSCPDTTTRDNYILDEADAPKDETSAPGVAG